MILSILENYCVFDSRNNYRRYKDLYKQLLSHPDAINFNDQLEELSITLDVSNLAMAREQARLEVL